MGLGSEEDAGGVPELGSCSRPTTFPGGASCLYFKRRYAETKLHAESDRLLRYKDRLTTCFSLAEDAIPYSKR